MPFPVISGNCPQTDTVLNATNGEITDGPGDYLNSLDCWWTIAPKDATQVDLRFTQFELEGPASCCAGDFIEIFECTDIACQNRALIRKLTGTMSDIPWSLISKTGIMRIHFSSDFQSTMSGFDSFYFSPCPAGTFGPGLPNCTRCTSTCQSGKQLRLTSCGAIGATLDNECVCPGGAFLSQNNASCLNCRSSCETGGLPWRLHPIILDIDISFVADATSGRIAALRLPRLQQQLHSLLQDDPGWRPGSQPPRRH